MEDMTIGEVAHTGDYGHHHCAMAKNQATVDDESCYLRLLAREAMDKRAGMLLIALLQAIC
jgi:hypothetical protein